MNSSPGDVGAKRVELSLAETVEESIAGIVMLSLAETVGLLSSTRTVELFVAETVGTSAPAVNSSPGGSVSSCDVFKYDSDSSEKDCVGIECPT